MLSSSIQATLIGRYADSNYGRSKLIAEKYLLQYGEKNNVKVAIYRFPNLMAIADLIIILLFRPSVMR